MFSLDNKTISNNTLMPKKKNCIACYSTSYYSKPLNSQVDLWQGREHGKQMAFFFFYFIIGLKTFYVVLFSKSTKETKPKTNQTNKSSHESNV